MKPPVDAPTSSAVRPVGVDPEGVERRGQLVAAPADVRLRLRDLERRGRIDRVAGLVVQPRGIAVADADLAGQDQRLGSSARVHQPTLDEQLVEADALRPGAWRSHGSRPYRGTARSPWTQPARAVSAAPAGRSPRTGSGASTGIRPVPASRRCHALRDARAWISPGRGHDHGHQASARSSVSDRSRSSGVLALLVAGCSPGWWPEPDVLGRDLLDGRVLSSGSC